MNYLEYSGTWGTRGTRSAQDARGARSARSTRSTRSTVALRGSFLSLVEGRNLIMLAQLCTLRTFRHCKALSAFKHFQTPLTTL